MIEGLRVSQLMFIFFINTPKSEKVLMICKTQINMKNAAIPYYLNFVSLQTVRYFWPEL